MSVNSIALGLLFGAIFVALVAWAIYSDMNRLTIPNWITMALIANFYAYAMIVANDVPIWEHSILAFTVFVAGVALFLLNWFGGGDVKFLAAVVLWAGPTGVVPLLLIMSLAGLVLGIAILCARAVLAKLPSPKVLQNLIPGWVSSGPCPYGVAIGLAALIVVPGRIF